MRASLWITSRLLVNASLYLSLSMGPRNISILYLPAYWLPHTLIGGRPNHGHRQLRFHPVAFKIRSCEKWDCGTCRLQIKQDRNPLLYNNITDLVVEIGSQKRIGECHIDKDKTLARAFAQKSFALDFNRNVRLSMLHYRHLMNFLYANCSMKFYRDFGKGRTSTIGWQFPQVLQWEISYSCHLIITYEGDNNLLQETVALCPFWNIFYGSFHYIHWWFLNVLHSHFLRFYSHIPKFLYPNNPNWSVWLKSMIW